jgi:uncharacterized RDD family membrane protein YckC
MPDATVKHQAAGIGRRVLSMLYEALVMLALSLFAGFIYHVIPVDRFTGESRRVFQLYLFLVLGAYFIACWTRGGRTLPMQTWRIRVIDKNGHSVGVARAMLRYVLAWPSFALLGGGLLWAFVDRDHQFLHDRLAGTRIVLTKGPSPD